VVSRGAAATEVLDFKALRGPSPRSSAAALVKSEPAVFESISSSMPLTVAPKARAITARVLLICLYETCSVAVESTCRRDARLTRTGRESLAHATWWQPKS